MCVIVIYGNLTFKLSFATKHYLHSFPEGKEEAQKGKMNECGSDGLTPKTDQKHGNVFEHRPFSILPSLLSSIGLY